MIFENQTYFEYIKTEFNKRKKRQNIFTSFFEVLFIGTINFNIKREWNQKYNIIKKEIINLYESLEVTSNHTPNHLEMFKNYNKNRIDFNFDKSHVAVTKKSIYFFPYLSSEKSNFMINSLEKHFKIDLPNTPYNNHSLSKNIKLLDLKSGDGKTVLHLRIDELKELVYLMLNEEITIANNV